MSQGISKPTEEVSLEDQVRAAYEAVRGTSEVEKSESLAAEEEPVEEPTEPSEAAQVEDAEEPAEDSAETASEESKAAEEEIAPPVDWNAQAKEWFKAQPQEFKLETKRIAEQYNRWRQTQVTQINQQKRELQALHADMEDAAKVVRKWLPRWNAGGETEWSAMAKLCAFNELVIRDLPSAIRQLAKTGNLNVTIEGEKAHARPEPQDSTTIKEQVKRELNDEYRQVFSQQQVEQQAGEWEEALVGIMNDVNEQGKYMFPDIHNTTFQMELEPLAAALWRRDPTQDKRDILMKAYRANNGRVIPRLASTKLNGSRTTAARKATSSISGTLNQHAGDVEAEPGESVEQSVKRAIARLAQQ